MPRSTARRVTTPASSDDPRVEADRLDLLADAWLVARPHGRVLDARQRAYERFVETGEHRRGGQAAVWFYEHPCFLGRPSMGNGWLRRALEQDQDQDCVEWGNLLIREAEVLHGLGELDRALDQAQAALDLARRIGSTNLEGEELQTVGRILIDDGRPHDGIAHLDEAMLLAVEERLSPYATGKVYCSLIGACEDLGDLRRAAYWTDATVRWSDRHPFAVFPGLCRTA